MPREKSFVLYADILPQLDMLSDEECGKLFKSIVRYVDDRSEHLTGERVVDVILKQVYTQIDRDKTKYAAKREKLKKNAEKRWADVQKFKQSVNGTTLMQLHSIVGDNVSDSVSDSVSDIKKEGKEKNVSDGSLYGNFMNWYNQQIDGIPCAAKISTMTDKRKKAFDSIKKEYGSDTIGTVLNKVKNSNFLRGETAQKFKLTVDWLLKKDNFIKVMEGSYDD